MMIQTGGGCCGCGNHRRSRGGDDHRGDPDGCDHHGGHDGAHNLHIQIFSGGAGNTRSQIFSWMMGVEVQCRVSRPEMAFQGSDAVGGDGLSLRLAE